MKIEPKYISFKTSILLKDKGFNIPLSKVYNNSGNITNSHYPTMSNDNVDMGISCVAPEQWMVIDWFLEEYGVFIEVRRTSHYKMIEYQPYYNEIPLTGQMGGYRSFETPYQAVDEMIAFLLNNKV